MRSNNMLNKYGKNKRQERGKIRASEKCCIVSGAAQNCRLAIALQGVLYNIWSKVRMTHSSPGSLCPLFHFYNSPPLSTTYYNACQTVAKHISAYKNCCRTAAAACAVSFRFRQLFRTYLAKNFRIASRAIALVLPFPPLAAIYKSYFWRPASALHALFE